MKPFIGIKRIWYGDVLATEPTIKTLSTVIQSMTEVTNSHDGTWSYEQDDPDTTDYKNELTGQTYYTDKTSDGAHNINFTMGVYEFEDKATLQGGEVIKDNTKTVGWKSKTSNDLVKKCIVAQTKVGHYIVFTNATIIAKADTQEKNIGLGVKAIAQENDNAGVASEYWFDGDAVTVD